MAHIVIQHQGALGATFLFFLEEKRYTVKALERLTQQDVANCFRQDPDLDLCLIPIKEGGELVLTAFVKDDQGIQQLPARRWQLSSGLRQAVVEAVEHVGHLMREYCPVIGKYPRRN